MGNKNKIGFTLIELLVVIAVIGLLASVVMVAMNSARVKARDARLRADLKQISTAIQLYYDKHGSMPINRNPCCGYPDTSPNFLQELVDDGYLSKNPKSPNPSYSPYYYYDYGPGNIGAIVVGVLETGTPNTTGEPGTCRPFDQNWCSNTISSNQYCLCNGY